MRTQPDIQMASVCLVSEDPAWPGDAFSESDFKDPGRPMDVFHQSELSDTRQACGSRKLFEQKMTLKL